ncbi:unnamed protein product [Peronospora belbahrii]|uniref:RxLR effector protein n=1 Tax=Peronospora belbahrii TaxID=622444 RepID=A0ABN8CU57_9STRA|nr:unnamed protein product [Peronospora belbahrii]
MRIRLIILVASSVALLTTTKGNLASKGMVGEKTKAINDEQIVKRSLRNENISDSSAVNDEERMMNAEGNKAKLVEDIVTHFKINNERNFDPDLIERVIVKTFERYKKVFDEVEPKKKEFILRKIDYLTGPNVKPGELKDVAKNLMENHITAREIASVAKTIDPETKERKQADYLLLMYDGYLRSEASASTPRANSPNGLS